MTRHEAREYIGRLINRYNSKERRTAQPARMSTVARTERDRYSYEGSWFDDDKDYPDEE